MRLFTEVERVEVWERRQAGEGNRSIGRRLGRSAGSIRAFVESSGGVRPPVRQRSRSQLSLTEREEISRGIAAGEPLCAIASRLGRAASTISRELARNGGRGDYRAASTRPSATTHHAAHLRRHQRPRRQPP
ncbi:MAG: helix-turn-helix domain-containing protein [Acidobacteria bacterium]|nr:helix-turn-helix domain-containing protein [Acidobacteriota bacterium]